MTIPGAEATGVAVMDILKETRRRPARPRRSLDAYSAYLNRQIRDAVPEDAVRRLLPLAQEHPDPRVRREAAWLAAQPVPEDQA